MSKNKYIIIQFHAVIAVMGYWLMHSVLNIAVGETSTMTSIVYDILQLLLSLYVINICKQDVKIENGRSMLSFYSILLLLYSLRMFYDMSFGPFSSVIPLGVFINDIIFRVIHIFVSVWAIIVSRKYLDVNIISRILFWMSFVTVILIIVGFSIRGVGDLYEEERMEGGRGLGSLALARIGAITVLASIHNFLNDVIRRNKFIYIAGMVFGVWLTLASGARGALAAIVIALCVYWLFSTRRNVFMSVSAIFFVILFVVNIETILLWLSNYFPVIGQRMLATIIENDQSGRQELRALAIQRVIDNPLFGFSYRLGPSETGYGAHNGILGVFLALGIPIGILFVFFSYIKPVFTAIKIMPHRENFLPTTMCIFVLAASMSGSSITDIRFGFAICLLASTYYYGNRSKISKFKFRKLKACK